MRGGLFLEAEERPPTTLSTNGHLIPPAFSTFAEVGTVCERESRWSSKTKNVRDDGRAASGTPQSEGR